MNREEKIRLIRVFLIIGFFCAVAFHYLAGTHFDLNYPFNTFLFRPWDRYSDFTGPFMTSITLNPYAEDRVGFASNYFPFTHVMLHGLSFLSVDMALTLFMFVITGFMFWSSHVSVGGKNRIDAIQNAVVFTFFSYPVLFALDRGNIELIAYAFIFLFLRFFRQGRTWLAVIFLAMAASLKGYPAILAVLFLADRRAKAFLAVAGVSIALTLGSLLLFDGSMMNNVTMLMSHLAGFNAYYVIGIEGLFFEHSLFGLIKVVALWVDPWNVQDILAVVMPFYNGLFLATILGVMAYVIFIETCLWRRVAALVIPMVLMPPVSFDYTLIILLLPLYLFLDDSQQGVLADRVVALLFGMLLIPKAYFSLLRADVFDAAFRLNPLLKAAHRFWPDEVSCSVVITPVLLVGLLGVVVAQGFVSWRQRRRA